MIGSALLGRGDLGAIASLCQRGVKDSPSPAELESALFDPDQPAVIRGDPAVGVVATVTCAAEAHLRLLVVDPAHRGHGYGHQLLAAAEDGARQAGHRSLTTGADAPFFLWPGVPTTETATLCLFERRRYKRVEVNFDMRVELDSIPDDPGGHMVATAADRPAVDAWLTAHWANWRAEGLRALDKGNLILGRDEAGIAAICAFEVNRTGFLGPVAARPDLLGRGQGRPPLLGALHELRRRGRHHVDVCWVGPIPPYAALGATLSNVYFVYRRKLAPPA